MSTHMDSQTRFVRGFGTRSCPLKLDDTAYILKIHYIEVNLYHLECLNIKFETILSFLIHPSSSCEADGRNSELLNFYGPECFNPTNIGV